MYVAEGLAGNRIAIIHKVHHVLADGVASANQMAKAMGPHEPSASVVAHPTRRAAHARSLLKAAGRDHVGLIRKLPRLVQRDGDRGLAGATAVQGARRSIPISPAISRRRSASSTMSSPRVAGSRRRRWHSPTSRRPASTSASRSTTSCWRRPQVRCAACCCATTGEPMSPLIAGVPVSTNASPDRLAGNEFTYMTPSLPVHIADPLERVRLTSLSTAIAKENHQLLGPDGAARLDVLPSAGGRAEDLPPPGQACRVGKRVQPDRLERARTPRARPYRGRARSVKSIRSARSPPAAA